MQPTQQFRPTPNGFQSVAATPRVETTLIEVPRGTQDDAIHVMESWGWRLQQHSSSDIVTSANTVGIGARGQTLMGGVARTEYHVQRSMTLQFARDPTNPLAPELRRLEATHNAQSLLPAPSMKVSAGIGIPVALAVLLTIAWLISKVPALDQDWVGMVYLVVIIAGCIAAPIMLQTRRQQAVDAKNAPGLKIRADAISKARRLQGI